MRNENRVEGQTLKGDLKDQTWSLDAHKSKSRF